MKRLIVYAVVLMIYRDLNVCETCNCIIFQLNALGGFSSYIYNFEKFNVIKYSYFIVTLLDDVLVQIFNFIIEKAILFSSRTRNVNIVLQYVC